MSEIRLGKLEKISNLREVWKKKIIDYTKC